MEVLDNYSSIFQIYWRYYVPKSLLVIPIHYLKNYITEALMCLSTDTEYISYNVNHQFMAPFGVLSYWFFFTPSGEN